MDYIHAITLWERGAHVFRGVLEFLEHREKPLNGYMVESIE